MLDADYQAVNAEILAQLRENVASANQHIELLEETKKELMQSGGCAEYSNKLVSIFNHKMSTQDYLSKMMTEKSKGS